MGKRSMDSGGHKMKFTELSRVKVNHHDDTIDITFDDVEVVARLEIHSLQWGDGIKVQGVLKYGGTPQVGKTYLLVEEAN